MLKFLFRKKEGNIGVIIEKEFNYKIFMIISQGVGCRYKDNSKCIVANPCYFKDNGLCNYNRFRWFNLRQDIDILKEKSNEQLRDKVEKEIIWLENHKIEVSKYFRERLNNQKQKV